MDIRGTLVGGEYYADVEQILMACRTHGELEEAVVEAPFKDKRVSALLGLGIIGFLLVDKNKATIKRVAFTDNEMTKGSFGMSAQPIKDIRIPLNAANNFIARAIRDDHYMITSDWQYLFNPRLTPEQSRFIQAGGGIACSVIYPLPNVLNNGALVFSYYETIDRIAKEHHAFMARYVSLVQKAFQKLS